MKKWSPLVIAVVVLFAGVGYLIHLYLNYSDIKATLKSRAAVTVHASVDSESVSEVGYIYEMRDETYIRRGRFNLVWFVVVPSTNRKYSCLYEAGHQGFAVGDSVRIIRKRRELEDMIDFTGYIVGLHNERPDKTAMVSVNDLEDLYDALSSGQ
jgi:hypothetical protein